MQLLSVLQVGLHDLVDRHILLSLFKIRVQLILNLAWMITSFCVVRLRQTEPDAERPYRIPGGSVTAWFSAIVMTILFILLFVPNNPVNMGRTAIILFIVWMALGLVMYLVSAKERNKVPEEERKRRLFAKVG